MNIYIPLLISLLAGLSTVLGSLVIFIKIKKIDSFIAFSLSFSLSVMLFISILDLLPNSIRDIVSYYGITKGFLYIIFILVLGYISIFIIEFFMYKNSKIEIEKGRSKLYKTAILSMIALIIHNFPEGIATFMASYKDLTLGLSLGIAIMMHNIPEGILLAVPLYYSSKSRVKAIGYSLISGLAEPLGAILAFMLFKDHINNISISVVLIYVAGVMITLSINELLPSALIYKKNKPVIIGLILGLLLVIINVLAL
ncbi:MAG: ZIP family metal transporter [Bacilli bacterium]